MHYRSWFAALVVLVATAASADELTKDAAVGGGIGGAVGGAIGAELGGREGAIVGSGVGAALGTAIATNDAEQDGKPVAVPPVVIVTPGHPRGVHCPPGQAKKGRC